MARKSAQEIAREKEAKEREEKQTKQDSQTQKIKVLAVNTNGDITYCTVPPESRGKGRCNHIAHQNIGESTQDFIARIDSLREEVENEEIKDFIPMEGTTIETKPYRMTEEEKKELTPIESRMQLDQNIEGGYIEVEEPLWNDMDKNYFAEKSGIYRKNIDAVLHKEAYVVIKSDLPKFPVGKVIPNELVEKVPDEVELGTGIEDFNYFAREVYGWEATRDIYVLPYYMRIGSSKVTDEFGEEVETPISSDITTAYKYLLRNHNNPDAQQLAYEALLNNDGMSDTRARYTKGFKNKSLSNQFAGKGGVFRACLSGSSIPYSARAVITPEVMPYGTIKVPASMAIDIYKPTLLEQLAYEGKSVEEIDEYFRQFRMPQEKIPRELKNELEERIKDKRVIMNRQPSLHTSSLQSFKPKISNDSTVKIHPLYCESYGADFDGDTVSIYGINSESIIPVVDKEIDAHNFINTHKPRSTETSAIMPSKDALFGLLNILERRSDK